MVKKIWSETKLDYPPSLCSEPSASELGLVRQTLQKVREASGGGDIGHFQVTGSSAKFHFDYSKKEFSVVDLATHPQTNGELWALRVFICLGKMGWEADNMVVDMRDDRPPGGADPAIDFEAN
jgi:hypothetical protein